MVILTLDVSESFQFLDIAYHHFTLYRSNGFSSLDNIISQHMIFPMPGFRGVIEHRFCKRIRLKYFLKDEITDFLLQTERARQISS
jgi:hypothetical protein